MNDHLHGVPTPVAEDLAAQDASLDVTCSACGVQRDVYCVNTITGQHLHGRVSHWQRVKQATDRADTGDVGQRDDSEGIDR